MSKKIGQQIIINFDNGVSPQNLLQGKTVVSLSIYATPGTKFGINYSPLTKTGNTWSADSEIIIGNLGMFQISDTSISNLCILAAPGLSTNDNISHFITIDYVYEESEAAQQ